MVPHLTEVSVTAMHICLACAFDRHAPAHLKAAGAVCAVMLAYEGIVDVDDDEELRRVKVWADQTMAHLVSTPRSILDITYPGWRNVACFLLHQIGRVDQDHHEDIAQSIVSELMPRPGSEARDSLENIVRRYAEMMGVLKDSQAAIAGYLAGAVTRAGKYGCLIESIVTHVYPTALIPRALLQQSGEHQS